MADASRPLRLYWDSCVFIEFLDPKVKEREKALRALVKFMDREAPPFTIVMSHLVLAEVRTRYGADEATTEIIRDLFDADRPYIEQRAVTRGIGDAARDIGLKHGDLTVPDCVHIATACLSDVDYFFTYDGDRDKKRRRSKDLLKHDGKVRVSGNRHLRIKIPFVPSGPLFEDPEPP